jgi:acyl dehydratase
MTFAEIQSLEGREAGVSPWLEVSQSMIDAFAALTGDAQWIHVDAERARRESPFGATVAHGFLTLSLFSRLVHGAVAVESPHRLSINYGFNRVRFISPVPAGSRIRARVVVGSAREIAGGAIEIVWNVTLDVEGRDKPAVAAEWILRRYN